MSRKPENLKAWIEEAANGESVEAVVIGTLDYGDEDVPKNDRRAGQVLSWEDAAPLLDYSFDCGHGTAGCEPVIAWTASRVIFIGEYDGATWPAWVPRHPVALMPGHSGQRTEPE